MYAKFWKRFFDFIISLAGLVILSPVFVILIAAGTISMGGNPFFTQERPGLHGKIFKLVKFRSMSDKKDSSGNLLPDEERLNKYGQFLRKLSIDELPELWNIFKGDMAIVGPRPLLVEYLPLYNEKQSHRHDVRPGLTGLAQVNGRNAISWEAKFDYDIEYVNNVSLSNDINILIKTVKVVLGHEGISSETSATMEKFTGTKDQ